MKTYLNLKWGIYLRYRALMETFKISLGSEYYFQGKVYSAINGIDYNFEHEECWTTYVVDVRTLHPKKDCKLKLTYKNIKRNYINAFMFYNTNWLDIWIRNNKVDTWMKVWK